MRQQVEKAANESAQLKKSGQKNLKSSKPSIVKSPDQDEAYQKAESKRRIRAINPTNETW